MFLQARIRFLRVVIRKLGGEKKYLLILILPKNIRVLQINTSNLLLVIQFMHLFSRYEYAQTHLFIELWEKEKKVKRG